MGDDKMAAIDSLRNIFKRTVASAMSNFAMRLVLFPLDTVRARLICQGCSSALPIVYNNGTLGCFRQIWQTEGITGFYNGCGSMLISIVPEVLATAFMWSMCRAVVQLVYDDDYVEVEEEDPSGQEDLDEEW